MVPLLRAPLDIIGYGSVATDIVIYNAYQEHGFPVPGMAMLSYRLRHICTAKFSHQIRFTDYECKRFLGDVKSVFPP